MRARTLKHLSDRDLLHDYTELLARDRAITAELLAALAEVDARRLYVPAGYPSMYLFCVQELHMSEDEAYLRIRAARAARRFPAIFELLADGRLHLSGVVLLAPFVTTENAAELLEAATHRSKAEIRALLAERFPRPDLPARVEPVLVAGLVTDRELGPDPVGSIALEPAAAPASELVPDRVGTQGVGTPGSQLVPERVEEIRTSISQLVPDPVVASAPRPKLTPLAPERFAVQLTIGRATHDKLCHARALLSHRMPSGDLAAVLDLALDALISQIEKRKFAATCTPRPRTGRSSNPRHIPAHVKRAVWERDGARCTFVSETGQRCPARNFLEYDHVDPVARGGQATVDGVRLRCRAHNQYEAERVFGAGFMGEKREAAARRAEAASARFHGSTSRFP